MSWQVNIITQWHPGIPPLWDFPRSFGGYLEYTNGHGKQFKSWYRNDKIIKRGTTLEEIVAFTTNPPGAKPLVEATLDRLAGIPSRLQEKREGFRWWIEGRNY